MFLAHPVVVGKLCPSFPRLVQHGRRLHQHGLKCCHFWKVSFAAFRRVQRQSSNIFQSSEFNCLFFGGRILDALKLLQIYQKLHLRSFVCMCFLCHSDLIWRQQSRSQVLQTTLAECTHSLAHEPAYATKNYSLSCTHGKLWTWCQPKFILATCDLGSQRDHSVPIRSETLSRKRLWSPKKTSKPLFWGPCKSLERCHVSESPGKRQSFHVTEWLKSSFLQEDLLPTIPKRLTSNSIKRPSLSYTFWGLKIRVPQNSLVEEAMCSETLLPPCALPHRAPELPWICKSWKSFQFFCIQIDFVFAMLSDHHLLISCLRDHFTMFEHSASSTSNTSRLARKAIQGWDLAWLKW